MRLLIEYDGTNFFGWQSQPNKRTVQGEIKAALHEITNENIKIIGAGRTDRGVHALGQVANFHTSSNIDLQQMRKGVNSLTGEDIFIKSIDRVDDKFHSRYSAKTKIYHYHIIFEPSPLKIRSNWFVNIKLDIPRMKKVIPHISGEHDFRNFSAADENNNKVCKIFNINLTEEDSHIIVNIEADRFLRRMVCGIVGFLYDIGRGRFSPGNTEDVFARSLNDIYFAPPQGLFLMRVRY